VPPTSEFPAMTSVETSAPWEYPSRTSFWFGQFCIDADFQGLQPQLGYPWHLPQR
jgi:hypothetical protein